MSQTDSLKNLKLPSLQKESLLNSVAILIVLTRTMGPRILNFPQMLHRTNTNFWCLSIYIDNHNDNCDKVIMMVIMMMMMVTVMMMVIGTVIVMVMVVIMTTMSISN